MNLVELLDLLKISCVGIGHVYALDIFRLEPLADDQDVHPAEKCEQKKEGRDELEVEIESVAEVDTVQALQNDTERHLDDGKDNCHLHLKVVGEREQLVGQGPHWVETNGVNAIGQLVQIRSVSTKDSKGISPSSVAVKRIFTNN